MDIAPAGSQFANCELCCDSLSLGSHCQDALGGLIRLLQRVARFVQCIEALLLEVEILSGGGQFQIWPNFPVDRGSSHFANCEPVPRFISCGQQKSAGFPQRFGLAML
jgi:hypothetical protein